VSDSLKIQSIVEVPTGLSDDAASAGNEKLQAMGRSLISGLYMLVRSVKMYDPDNAVFEKPLAQLEETMNQIVRRDGKLELLSLKETFLLNGQIAKVDLAAIDNVRFLLAEMRERDIGGFTVVRPVNLSELKGFLRHFTKVRFPSDERAGTEGKKLVSLSVTRWSKLRERLEGKAAEGDAKIDRKKYALTCYGRAIVFLRHYIDSTKISNPIATAKAIRIIHDLVDLSIDQRTHFLGLTSTRSEADYLVYHQVNTCLIAIVFGAELGLTKTQLSDLGYCALFHDAGVAAVPEEILSKHSALSPEERDVIRKAPLVAVRNILREKVITRTTLLRLVTTFEHAVEFGTAVRDGQGNVQMIIPKSNLSAYAKIIAIGATYDALTSRRPFRDAYSPEVALMLMWTELRNKFDPDLLQVFMKVMAIQPIRVLTKRQQTLSIGVL
jgi:HD-GYP domain-containing protein (c-di-GMP phosphodiesterase class II)